MSSFKNVLKRSISRTPGLSHAVKWLYFFALKIVSPFKSSKEYWESRYKKGETSGGGSYSHLALYKAEVINAFVHEHEIGSIIEFGCGDGNQLLLAEYPDYLGVDVSNTALQLCRQRFSQDASKNFIPLADYDGTKRDASLSLDVIYHLVEDRVFLEHMHRLFSSAKRFVIIYSSDTDAQFKIQGEHIRHRKFTDWVDSNQPNWKLVRHIPNKYPYTGDESSSSFADFYIYEYKGSQ